MNNNLILSKQLIGDLLEGSSISDKGLQKICERLPELNRAKRAVGRKNSQTTSTLMTMTMLADSPYRQMKQCLAQIDNKRNALIEVHFKAKKNKVKIERWEKSGDALDAVEAEEARSQVEQMRSSAENAMKEIGMYQDIYDQIRTSHNIPLDWDEEDYEKTEIDNALRMSFRQAIQNLMSSGRIAISTVEYWEQFGVHPMVGEKLTRDYLASVDAELKENKLPSVVSMHKFLDQMVETFRDEHKHSLTRLGVDAIINHQYAYKKKKQ
jgi:hypothetical protein|tara:strand:- start:291 stop:1091 length:801 start_codon:yes stop_codon:yes gene_type:complete